MIDRRAQWLRFYEAALTGTCATSSGGGANGVARYAGDVADAAMARLDARTFPPSKVRALVELSYDILGSGYLHGAHQEALSDVLAALKAES